MIVIDYSQIALASVYVFAAELKGAAPEKVTDIIRHVTLSSIKSYAKKYGPRYGKIIICGDGRNYWRRDVFKYYKGQRKAARDKSDLPWTLIFDTMTSILDDLRDYFPYKVLRFDDAEADDIIAVLTQYLTENDLVKQGLEFSPAEILIVSSDKDFKELQLLGDHVKQFAPAQKKFITGSHMELRNWCVEHIVRGDKDDGVPNILSDDDVFMDETKHQKKVTQARLDEFYKLGRDACRGEMELRNWDRNQILVDLLYIPDHIKEEILTGYKETVIKGNKQSIMNYLIKHRCRLLLREIDEF